MIILIPVFLAVMDLGTIIFAVQLNDATCKMAARTASLSNPTEAQNCAKAVVADANKRSGKLPLSLVSVSTDVTPAELEALVPYGGLIQGSVTVQTEVSVTPFLVHWAYGGKSPLKFVSRQTIPFSYSVPRSSS